MRPRLRPEDFDSVRCWRRCERRLTALLPSITQALLPPCSRKGRVRLSARCGAYPAGSAHSCAGSGAGRAVACLEVQAADFAVHHFRRHRGDSGERAGGPVTCAGMPMARSRAAFRHLDLNSNTPRSTTLSTARSSQRSGAVRPSPGRPGHRRARAACASTWRCSSPTTARW
jgi:hypothetical protein